MLQCMRDDQPFALASVQWLLSMQSDDEIASGSSLHRNKQGLSKTHAELLARKHAPCMSHDELVAIGSAYTDTQLMQAVSAGHLAMPPRPVAFKRRKLAHFDDDSGDEQAANDEDSDAEEDAKNVLVTSYGIHCGSVVAPSRQMCARVGKIVARVKSQSPASMSSEFPPVPPWVPADVHSIVHDEDSWSGIHIDENLIDAALYYALPPIKYTANRMWIRIFWASEERWATARVDRVSKIQGTQLNVELYFPDEKLDGSVTGADALFAYELRL